MTAAIGLGLAALGRPGYMTLGHAEDVADPSPEAMERRCHELLDTAYAAGVRYVDAARSYGRAEEFLARWLAARGLAPGAITIGSKWGYTYTAGWRAQAERHEVKDHSVAAFRRQLGETRALLGEHLRLYLIHSVTPDSPALGDAELLRELAALRDQGVTIGLSVSGPRQAELIARALELRAGGARLFGAVQASWNLHEQAAGAMLRAAREAGLFVVVKEAMANGRLAQSAPAPLVGWARELGATPDAVALAAVLAQGFADVVLSGAVLPAQLLQNLAARDLQLGSARLSALLAELREEPAAYWPARAALPWT